MYPTVGAFACRTPSCQATFADFKARNAHESRCKFACKACGVSFWSTWTYENHKHEHVTGLAFCCRLGCKVKNTSTALDSYLWFATEAAMRKHHLVDHGATYATAREVYDASGQYNDTLFIPLPAHADRLAALAEYKAENNGYVKPKSEEQLSQDRNVHNVYKKNRSDLESDHDRDTRRRRTRELDVGVYQRIKANPVRFAHRSEKLRINDRRRRSDEPTDKREACLKKKREGEARRRRNLAPKEREERNAKRRVNPDGAARKQLRKDSKRAREVELSDDDNERRVGHRDVKRITASPFRIANGREKLRRRGAFGCETLHCNQVFDNWEQRNKHQARCKYACPDCPMASFWYLWNFNSHIHEHHTGLGHRCRLGCPVDNSAEDYDSDDPFIWFQSEYLLRRHHEVDHGCSVKTAFRELRAPEAWEGDVYIPLCSESERADNLAAHNSQRRIDLENTNVDVEKRRKTRQTLRANEKALESDEQRADRLARTHESDKATYERIKQDPVRYDKRLETARKNDHIRRANEVDDVRQPRLAKKRESTPTNR